MCGIVGYAGIAGGIDLETLVECRDALAHRGPDDAACWVSRDGRVAFGHRRLAIVELTQAGAQPMHWRQPALTVTFNGEIYNHGELRRELRAQGHVFRGHSDTEVILAAYAQWGRGGVDRLRGMFAFALYDHAQRSLLLARDRAGEKPLYWVRHRGGLMFASELKALFADPAFARRVDLQGLDAYLAFGYVPGDRCLIDGVHKVPPGHLIEYALDAASVETRRYWDKPPARPDPGRSEQDLVDELDRLADAAVREQLQADVPVAVLLSGGIDSSLVTACAARASADAVTTFTLGFPGAGEFDERPHARRVAQHFATRHTELELEPASLDLLPALARHYDEPIADSSIIPTYLISRLVARHGKVVLGGDGGDELFGGYRSYQGATRVEQLRRVCPRPLRVAMAAAARAGLPVGFPGRNALVGFGADLADGVARMGLMFDRPMRRHLAPALQESAAGVDAPLAWKRSLVDTSRGVPGAYMAADFDSYLPGDILVKVDRASMANSLEVRAPWLDQRIVEFAFAEVPNELRVAHSERKILLRRLARRLLPADFDVERKQGFSIPLAAWLTPAQREHWCAHFETRLGRLFDFAAVRRLAGDNGVGALTRLFGLLFLMHWMEEHHVSA